MNAAGGSRWMVQVEGRLRAALDKGERELERVFALSEALAARSAAADVRLAACTGLPDSEAVVQQEALRRVASRFRTAAEPR